MDIGKVASAVLVFFLGVIEVLLGFRFVFKLLAANSTAEFTDQIYSLSEPLVSPFIGVFPSFQVADFSLELSTALAMIVYAVFGFVILQLVKHFEGMKVKQPAITPLAPTPQAPTTPVMPIQPQQPYVPPMIQEAQPQQIQQPMPVSPLEPPTPPVTNS